MGKTPYFWTRPNNDFSMIQKKVTGMSSPTPQERPAPAAHVRLFFCGYTERSNAKTPDIPSNLVKPIKNHPCHKWLVQTIKPS